MTRLFSLLVTLLLPPLLLLANVMLVMSPVWLAAEYTRPGFPQDAYGLTTEQRIELATSLTAWLVSEESVAVPGAMSLADGSPLLNARELRHMQDVKTLTGSACRVALVAALIWAIAMLRCRRKKVLALALKRGALLTLGTLASIVALAVASWERVFTGFHRLFFESGTWYFAYSDTLIRLFPEQFWFDAVLFPGGMTALQALLLLVLVTRSRSIWRYVRRLLYSLPGEPGELPA